MAQKVQTLVFKKDRSPLAVNGGNGWTASAARTWLREHDLKAPQPDETDNTFRFRQFDPERCRDGTFQTLTQNFPRGVSAVSCDAEDRQEDASAFETLALRFQLEADDDLEEGRFRGVASAFDTPIDTFPLPTIIEPGAFAGSIERNRQRVKVLWQHDPHEPIGVPERLAETRDGIEITGAISPTARGRDALQLLRDNVITELSIGFDPVRWRVEKRGEGSERAEFRVLEEGELWEVSLVTWGANRRARIMDVNDRQRSGAPAPSDPVYDLAPVSHEWSPAGALTRLQRHTTGDDGGRDERTYRSAFAGGLDALPIADVVNGKLHVVPAAVFRAAALLPSLGLEAEEAGRVRAELGRHYARMDRTPPWERSGDCLELFERFLSVRIEPDTGAIPEDQRADLHKALVQIARLVGPYEGQTLPFADVARYLDAEIASWRERRERGDTEAHHYLNALQAARTALLGRPLAAEPESPAVDAERLEDVSRRTEEAERLLAETQGV